MRGLVVHVEDGHLGEGAIEGAQRHQKEIFGEAAKRHPYHYHAAGIEAGAGVHKVLQIVEVGVGLVAQVCTISGDNVVGFVGVLQVRTGVVKDDSIAWIRVFEETVIRSAQVGCGRDDFRGDLDAVYLLEGAVSQVGIGGPPAAKTHGEGRFGIPHDTHGNVGEGFLIGQHGLRSAGHTRLVDKDITSA